MNDEIKTKKRRFKTRMYVRLVDNPNEWAEVEGEINLGSINNPNSKILEVRIVQQEILTKSDIFGGFEGLF